MSRRNSISLVSRVTSFILALYVLNFSVDTRDNQPNWVGEDLSHNDIESFVELALEVVLDVENAVPEHEEQDDDDGSSFEFKKFCCMPLLSSIIGYTHTRQVKNFTPYTEAVVNIYLEINSPPPEV